jgi:hypothetical protein
MEARAMSRERWMGFVLTMLLSLGATPVLAHPGHGADGGSSALLHYLIDPLHLGERGLLILLAATLWIASPRIALWLKNRF